MEERRVRAILILTFCAIYLSHRCSVAAWPFRRVVKLQCGRYQGGSEAREARIVGGLTAGEGEFPWMVSFKSRHGHFCGGSMISNRHILTAGHCLFRNDYLDYHKDGSVNLKSLNVTLGEYSLKNKSESAEVSVAVKKIHIHPKYDPVTKESDIAVVEITKGITSIAPHVVPVCLPSKSDVVMWEKGTKATVVGWGKLNFNQDYYDWVQSVDALQKVNVKIWDTESCIEKYKGFPKFPSKSFICAGEQGRESCTGDSGSPLLFLNGNRKWVAIGVVANGNKCGALGRPGIYTLVADFRSWLDSYTK